MISCKRCNYDKDESKIHLHHIIPKWMGGTDKTGRVYLCKPCHKELHLILKNIIKNSTEKYIDKK